MSLKDGNLRFPICMKNKFLKNHLVIMDVDAQVSEKVNSLLYELSLKKNADNLQLCLKQSFMAKKKRSLINRLFCIHSFCVAENSEYFLIVSCLLVHFKKKQKLTNVIWYKKNTCGKCIILNVGNTELLLNISVSFAFLFDSFNFYFRFTFVISKLYCFSAIYYICIYMYNSWYAMQGYVKHILYFSSV